MFWHIAIRNNIVLKSLYKTILHSMLKQLIFTYVYVK